MKFDYQQNIRKLKLWFSHIDALYLYSACVCMRHFLRMDWSSFLALRFSQAFGQLIHITATSLSLLGASESGKASAEMRARKAGCRMAIRRGLEGGHSIWSCSTAWLHKSHNTLRHIMANNAKCKNDMSNDVRDALAAPILLLLYSLKAICSVPRGSCSWYFRSGHCACSGWKYWVSWLAWCLW